MPGNCAICIGLPILWSICLVVPELYVYLLCRSYNNRIFDGMNEIFLLDIHNRSTYFRMIYYADLPTCKIGFNACKMLFWWYLLPRV